MGVLHYYFIHACCFIHRNPLPLKHVCGKVKLTEEDFVACLHSKWANLRINIVCYFIEM